jgi:hypothetical protein
MTALSTTIRDAGTAMAMPSAMQPERETALGYEPERTVSARKSGGQWRFEPTVSH